jgi:hypothetical protein
LGELAEKERCRKGQKVGNLAFQQINFEGENAEDSLGLKLATSMRLLPSEILGDRYEPAPYLRIRQNAACDLAEARTLEIVNPGAISEIRRANRVV